MIWAIPSPRLRDFEFCFWGCAVRKKKTQKNTPPRQGGGAEGGVGGFGVKTLPREYRLRVSMLCNSLARALSVMCWCVLGLVWGIAGMV